MTTVTVDPWDETPVTVPRGLLSLLLNAAGKADEARLLGNECPSDPCPTCTALVEIHDAVYPSPGPCVEPRYDYTRKGAALGVTFDVPVCRCGADIADHMRHQPESLGGTSKTATAFIPCTCVIMPNLGATVMQHNNAVDPRWDDSPLNDRDYDPAVKPVGGRIPDVVAKWGPRSQVRWFRRFHVEVGAQKPDVWDRFYAQSVEHRGLCCVSCAQDSDEGYGDDLGDHCCCMGIKVGL